jgi:ribosomal protein S18 acetylase RimI-like enzyme
VFEVRDARPEDMDGIADAHIAGWQIGYRGLVPDDAIGEEFAASRRSGWAARGRRIEAAGPEDGLLALLDDGRAIGFAHVGEERTQDGTETGHGELYGFYVHPDHWGSGAAAALIIAAEDRLRQLGFSDAVLYVFRDNPRARRFYEKAGWAFTGWEGSFDLSGRPMAEVKYGRTL